jgi:hypothetical protein
MTFGLCLLQVMTSSAKIGQTLLLVLVQRTQQQSFILALTCLQAICQPCGSYLRNLLSLIISLI